MHKLEKGDSMNSNDLNKFDIVYHARIHPSLGIYDLDELKVVSITDNYFTGMEKHSKRVFLFPYSAFGKNVFIKRQDALEKIREAEANKKEVSTETYYEEY